MSVTAAGRTASASTSMVCPPWCVVEHSPEADLARFPGDRDVIHRSASAWLRPDSSEEHGWDLAVHLAAPELGYAETLFVVDVGVPFDPYAELTAETADQFIRDLKTFTARVQQLRDQMGDRS